MSFLRTINKLCETRLEELGIPPSYRQKHVLCNSFIAGGALISVARQEKVKDYDWFVTDPGSARTLFNHLVARVPVGNYIRLIVAQDTVNPKLHRGILISEKPGVEVEELIDQFNNDCKTIKKKANTVYPVYLSKNALMLSNGVQLIFRFIGEPKEVFSTFDFEHCKTYWRPAPLGLLLGAVHYEGRSQESIAKNELIYTGNTRFVLSAISRLNKFISRGWGISPSSLLALAVTSSKVDWSSREALKEELLGIYGIENQTLETILNMCSEENKVDLDKVVQVLGEV
jgi:hypothetical protein